MNLLVTYLYNLSKEFPLHAEIHDLSVASYKKHLRGDWEHVCLRGEFRCDKRNRGYGLMLQDVFRKLPGLNDSNLLVVDADTLCVRPVEMFGKWDRLAMFNWANAEVPYGAFNRTEYLHSAVRYVPSNFAHWAAAAELVAEWDYAMWAYDQYVWNVLSRAQGGQDAPNPRYCWVPLPEYDNAGVPGDEAYIVHFGETRGLQECLEKMRSYAVQ